MASLTEEEENYFRIFKLVSGLAPKAVRDKFDWYFPPSTFCSIVKQKEPTLRHYYRRGWLNGSQLSLLFPTSGATSSTTYDLTLMICLLRNLTNIQPPVNGYDCLPLTSEICDGADLARVKYYRNQIAHSEKDTLSTQDFNKIWLDLTGAIIRLGGFQYQAICDDLSQQKFDTDVHVEFMRIFQTFKDDVVREINELKKKTEECGCYDFHQNEINEWLKEHTKFVKTDAADYVLKTIQENKRITVTGIPGIGKSALIRHVALNLCTKQGYTIIPCNSPSEIKTHFKEDRLQIFVFDDVCGRYILNQYDVEEWKKLQQCILGILLKANTRIISSCRLQIFNERGFQTVQLLSEVCCDLSSEGFALTKQQRIDIANQYLPKDTVDEIEDELQKCEMLPLICSLFETKQGITASDFFANPFEVYTTELDKLLFESSNKIKICVLFLLVVNNGYVRKEWLASEGRKQLADMLDACGVNRGTCTMEIIQQLESLVNTYLKKVENDYKAIHDKLFDFLCFYFGQRKQEELIKYADKRIIYERMFLCQVDELESDFPVFVTEKNEDIYFQRICKDISDGFIIDVLYSKSIQLEKFQTKICNYLKAQNKEDMMKIVKTRCHHCGDTSLQVACSLGYNDIVKCMISFINDINVVHTDEFPPLHQACFQRQDQIVKLLIDKGANLNSADFNGWTPLKWACEGRHHSIVNLLVQNGACVNEIITGGRTLLTECCLLGNDTIVDWLMCAGAKVNLADGTGETPLTLACAKGHYQIILLLIRNGADVNCCNKAGQTPILKTVMNAANYVKSLYEMEIECNIPSVIFPNGEILLQIIDLLISNGADVNKSDHDGWTVLHEVCESNNIQFLRELIKRKANVNQTLDDLRTPLMMACERGYKELVGCLVDNRADVNLSDEEGYTSLVLACENEHFDIAKYLISKGAHVKQVLKSINKNMIQNHYFDTLEDNLKDMDINWISEAAIIGNIDIVSYLINRGATVKSMTDSEKYALLLNSCKGKHENIVQFLIKEGIDVNKRTEDGESALLTACLSGNYKLVEILVDSGSKVNILNATHETPLIIACSIGNIPIARFLIDKGANVNVRDIHGDSALIHAIRYETMCLDAGQKYNKQFPLIRLLLNNYVCINRKNVIGDSPLIIAINYHYEELAIKLIDNDADCNLKDKNGYTPLMIAIKNKLESVVIALIKNREVNPEDVDIDWKLPDFIIVSVKNNDIDKMSINIKNKDINILLEIALKYYNKANIAQKNISLVVKAKTLVPVRLPNPTDEVRMLRSGTDIRELGIIKNVVPFSTAASNDITLTEASIKMLADTVAMIQQKNVKFKSNYGLGYPSKVRHKTKTGSNEPVKQPPRSTPVAMRKDHDPGCLKRKASVEECQCKYCDYDISRRCAFLWYKGGGHCKCGCWKRYYRHGVSYEKSEILKK